MLVRRPCLRTASPRHLRHRRHRRGRADIRLSGPGRAQPSRRGCRPPPRRDARRTPRHRPGSGYRLVYDRPGCGSPRPSGRSRDSSAPLPFVRRPVTGSSILAPGGHRRLSRLASSLWRWTPWSSHLAEGLLDAQADGRALPLAASVSTGPPSRAPARSSTIGGPSCDRPSSRPSRGLGRYELARQFRRSRHEPVPVLPHAPARLRAEPARQRHALGGAGAGGWLRRPGPLHAHVPLGVRPDARRYAARSAGPSDRPAVPRPRVTAAPEIPTAALDTAIRDRVSPAVHASLVAVGIFSSAWTGARRIAGHERMRGGPP